MNTEILPNSIPMNGHSITFGQIHELFAGSSFGHSLGQNVRFERYKPVGYSNKDWMKLLGADVNNLQHMPLTLRISHGFLQYCEIPTEKQFPNPADYTFTLDEKVDIQLAAIIHDWGEAVVGDILFDQKTAEHEIKEGVAIRSILEKLLHSRRNLHYRAERVISNVVENKNSHEGRAFNAIERIGYMRTGLRAYEQSIRFSSDLELQNALQWCANNVLFNQIPALIGYAQIYPPVDTYLSRKAERITEAFTIPDSILNNYQGDEQVKNRNKYVCAIEAWQSSDYYRSGII
jgi:hypothetical protein